MSPKYLITAALFPAGVSFSQVGNDYLDTPDSLRSRTNFKYNQGLFSLGTAYGIHPNLRNTEVASNYFLEADHAFEVKGLPVHLQARISDEAYKTGNASYFRLNYDAANFNRDKLQSIQEKIKLSKQQLALSHDSIQALEGKISYIRLKQFELKGMGEIPGVPDSLGMPKLPAGSLEIPDSLAGINLPDTPTLPQGDSLQFRLHALEKLLQAQQLKSLKLEKQSLDLQQQYDDLASKTNLSFLQGIRKFDLGLSTLSPGSMSKNRVPMQGIHVAGVVRKWFYDAAAGLTLPNQLFSNQAFDQLVNNTGNVFNMGEFFAVQSIRFVASTVVGYGDQGKNSVAVENFYTGRSLNEIRKDTLGLQQLATNLSFYHTPKRLPNLTWNGTVGTSFSNRTDGLPQDDNLAIASGITWKLPKQRGQLTALYRRLGGGYSGWSQGIFLQGTSHYEAGYRRALGKTSSIQLRGAQDLFAADPSTGSRRQTTQGSTEWQWKCLPRTSLIAGYTLLQLTGATSDNTALWSHLGKFGLYNNENHVNYLVSKSLDAGYALIAGPDSTQELIQSTGHISITLSKWSYGLKMQYTDMQGMSRLGGRNFVLNPEIAYKSRQLEFSAGYQQLFSEQFGAKPGLQVNFLFRFDEIVDISYSCQQWLPTDYTFFLPAEVTGIIKPIYMRGKVTIHLNNKTR